MMSDPSTTPSKRRLRRTDDATLIRFVEELGWLLEAYKDVDFSTLPKIMHVQRENRNRSAHLRSLSNQSDLATTLVGVLPTFFMDRKLFPQNEDLVEFAEQALGISMPRWDKKSKNELIGHIVCHTNKAPQKKLDTITRAIEDLVDENSDTRRRIEDQRRSGISWNEVIQSLILSR